MSTKRRPRDERGATAILVALLALVLVGIGAFAVDFGQAWAKKSLLQTDVDLAVMAAAAQLTTGGECNAEVVTTAKEFLNKNKVSGQQDPINLVVGSPPTPYGPTGYIHCSGWRVDLWAPTSHVDYGLGRVLTKNEGVDVPAHAAAQIKSPPAFPGTLPMYAVGSGGCDKGPQTIAEPPPGNSVTFPSPSSLSPAGTPPAINDDFTVTNTPWSSPPVQVTVTAKTGMFSAITAITFTTVGGKYQSVSTGPIAAGTTNTVTVSLPQAVLDAGGLWWVRLNNGTKYSQKNKAQPLVVGDLLYCNVLDSGNFGTIKVARSDSPAGEWLARNIMFGVQPTMTTNSNPSPPCTPQSDQTPTSPTNCLGTDPGFANAALTKGLVTGLGAGSPGRLDKDTKPGCGRNGGSARTVAAPFTAIGLNDDQLTCFITDPSVTIQQLVDGSAKGALSSDIFASPRFFKVPIFGVRPEHGSSTGYPIIGFRAGFITSEPTSATRSHPAAGLDTYNGVHFQSTHVDQLKVVLFDDAALPQTATPTGGEVAYTGTGPKVVVLVD